MLSEIFMIRLRLLSQAVPAWILGNESDYEVDFLHEGMCALHVKESTFTAPIFIPFLLDGSCLCSQFLKLLRLCASRWVSTVKLCTKAPKSQVLGLTCDRLVGMLHCVCVKSSEHYWSRAAEYRVAYRALQQITITSVSWMNWIQH